MASRWIYPLLIIAILAGCTSGGGSAPTQGPTTEPPTPPASGITVESGDLVWIDYTGRIKGDGRVFDTTIEEVGKDDSIPITEPFPISIVQSKEAHFEPLGLIIEKGESLLSLERDLIGMGAGQEKTITLTPDDAYGPRSSEYVIPLPRTQETPLEFHVPIDDYRKRESKEPVVGDTVQATPYWKAEVEEVTDTTVTLKHMPEDGLVVTTPYGPAQIRVKESSVVMIISPRIGSYIETPIGVARVVSMNETDIVADFNHPLAGKTLEFEIIVRNITKKDVFSDWNITFLGYEEGLQKAKAEDLPVVMELYWRKCPHCKRLNEETMTDPRVTEFRNEFVWIREEVREDRPELGEKYKINSYPTLIFMDSTGKEVKRTTGFMSALDLRWELEDFIRSL